MLTRSQKNKIILRRKDGLTRREIAEELGIKESQVNTYLFRKDVKAQLAAINNRAQEMLAEQQLDRIKKLPQMFDVAESVAKNGLVDPKTRIQAAFGYADRSGAGVKSTVEVNRKSMEIQLSDKSAQLINDTYKEIGETSIINAEIVKEES